MKAIRSYSFYDWYRVFVLLLGGLWRLSLGWPIFESDSVGLGDYAADLYWFLSGMAIGILPYVALAKVASRIEIKSVAVFAAATLLAGDIYVKRQVGRSMSSTAGVALMMYPLMTFAIILVVGATVSLLVRNRRP